MCVPQIVKPQIRYAGIFLRLVERSLNARFDVKHETLGVLIRSLVQPLKFLKQSLGDRDLALPHCLGVEGADGDKAFFEVNIAPRKLEHLTATHSGVQSADHNRLDMRAGTGTLCDQFGFFLSSQYALAWLFVTRVDERFPHCKRILEDPAIRYGYVEDTPKQG